MWVEDRDVSIARCGRCRRSPAPEASDSQSRSTVALMTEPLSQQQCLFVGAVIVAVPLGRQHPSGQWRMPVEKPHWYSALLQIFQSRSSEIIIGLQWQSALTTMLSLIGFERYRDFQKLA